MTYTTVEVARLTGATYRQLDYWARSGRIPGQSPGPSTGSGHRRLWSEADVERVRLVLRASVLINNNLDGAVAMLDREAV